MDTAGSRRVDFNALGGADMITVNDLTGTDVSKLNLDLAATLGGTAGDGQADQIIVNGTTGDDIVAVSGDATGVYRRPASRLRSRCSIRTRPTSSTSTALGGIDSLSAVALAAGSIALTLDGGAGGRPDRRRPGRRDARSAATGTTRSTATVATTRR